MARNQKRLSRRLLGVAAATLLAAAVCPSAQAQGLKDILSGLGSKTGSTVENVIEGIFTKSDLTVDDVKGTWVSEGPAVCFKTENFLKKAGGIAAAATIETELSPYYDQYGLNGMKLTIESDGTFKMEIKKISLSGTLSPNPGEGTFDFSFTAMGIPLGTYTAYVSAGRNTMDVMFDATKMKQFISAVARFTGNSMAKTVAGILDSYDGACIGFKMKRQGTNGDTTGTTGSRSVTGGKQGTSTSTKKTGSSTKQTGTQSGDSSKKTGVDALRDLLNKKKK